MRDLPYFTNKRNRAGLQCGNVSYLMPLMGNSTHDQATVKVDRTIRKTRRIEIERSFFQSNIQRLNRPLRNLELHARDRESGQGPGRATTPLGKELRRLAQAFES